MEGEELIRHYLEARNVEARTLARAYALPSADVGREYANFVGNAYLADNPYLVRAYLRILAKRPWWANLPKYHPPPFNEDTVERAQQLVERRVDYAIAQMDAVLPSPYTSVRKTVDIGIQNIVQLPLLDAFTGQYVLKQTHDELAAIEDRHLLEDGDEMDQEEDDQHAAWLQQQHAAFLERQERIWLEQHEILHHSEDENDAF